MEIEGLPAGSRWRSHRTSLRLPPGRAALPRKSSEREGSGLGRGPTAGRGLRHGRPRLPSPRRVASQGSRRDRSIDRSSCSAITTSRSRATRSRGLRSFATCERATLLSDEQVQVALRGETPGRRRRRPGRISRAARPAARARRARASFRLLLCHFPGIVDRMPDRVVRSDPHRAPPCGTDLRSDPAPAASPSRIPELGSCRACTNRGRDRCMSRPGTGTTFVPFRSSRARGDGARPSPAALDCAAMEGHAVISHEVLAAYAADAAREVDGVARTRRRPAASQRRPRRRGGWRNRASSSTSRWTGAPPRRRSAPRCKPRGRVPGTDGDASRR